MDGQNLNGFYRLRLTSNKRTEERLRAIWPSKKAENGRHVRKALEAKTGKKVVRKSSCLVTPGTPDLLGDAAPAPSGKPKKPNVHSLVKAPTGSPLGNHEHPHPAAR